MKKLYYALLVVLLCSVLFLLPTEARAETIVSHDWGQEGSEVSFRLDSNGTMTIFGTGAMQDQDPYFLGSFIDHVESSYWPVTSVVIEEGITYIGNQTFYEAKNLKSVTFPNSLEKLGFQVFSGCPKLTTIKFGTGLQETGIEVFFGCDSLVSVTLPNTDVDYGNGIFAKCNNLQRVTIPSAQTTISESMFENCRSLSSITLPNSITKIGGSAFEFCTSLRSINIPSSVTEIGPSAFENCFALTSITIPGTVTRVSSNMFDSCYKLSSVTFCEGIQELGDDLFGMCFELESVTIPASVVKMGDTFSMANYIKTVRFLGPAPDFGTLLFDYITATVYYPGNYPGWTEDVLQNYGGNITWRSYHLCYFAGLIPVYNSTDQTHTWTCDICGNVKTEACSFSNQILTEATRDNYGFRECICNVCSGSFTEQYAYRLFGSGRCETALAVATELKSVLGREKFDTVIIASGINFADALAGSYLAANKEAPILLYAPGYAGVLSSYISENLSSGGTVYILGGTAAVAADMETALSGYFVSRLAGADRLGTNLAILEEAGVTDEEILVCTAFNFADSLSASAVGLPILLVGNQLTEEQIAFLTELNENNLCIIGGESAVSAQIEEELQVYGSVQRVYGINRSETSVAVANRYFNSPEYAVTAYSLNFPDGLCGGPLAYSLGAPLLLVTPRMEAVTANYISANSIEKGLTLGGTAALSDNSVKIAFSLE